MNRKYTIPIFIGSTGINFYLNTITIDLFNTNPFWILVRLGIFLASAFILHRGYKLIDKDFSNKKSKEKWSIALLLFLIALISLFINYFFGFILGFIVGALLNFLLVIKAGKYLKNSALQR